MRTTGFKLSFAALVSALLIACNPTPRTDVELRFEPVELETGVAYDCVFAQQNSDEDEEATRDHHILFVSLKDDPQNRAYIRYAAETLTLRPTEIRPSAPNPVSRSYQVFNADGSELYSGFIAELALTPAEHDAVGGQAFEGHIIMTHEEGTKTLASDAIVGSCAL